MHLLIDFSDVLQTNLYVLGNLYLQLVKLHNFQIPQLDPSLFIGRFCNKLNFGPKTSLIANTALKILQAMKRNWLHLGRRPNGLSGAAILIAATCHEQAKSIEEVVDVVHICCGTIKKRVNEFSQTPIASLTKEELDKLPLIDKKLFNDLLMKDDMGMDPPSYIANRLKDLITYEKDLMNYTLEIEQRLYLRLNNVHRLDERDKVRIVFHKTTDKINLKRYVLDSNPVVLPKIHAQKTALEKTGESSIDSKTDTTITNQVRRSARIARKNSTSVTDKDSSVNTGYESEALSELNDNETEMYILTADEQRLKKNLWEVMYQDWIEDQENKKKLLEEKNKGKGKFQQNQAQITKDSLFMKRKRKLSLTGFAGNQGLNTNNPSFSTLNNNNNNNNNIRIQTRSSELNEGRKLSENYDTQLQTRSGKTYNFNYLTKLYD